MRAPTVQHQQKGRQQFLRIGSLFSGVGGLDMAVKAVFGGQVIWHSEIDPAASKVLAHHWPDIPNLGDISQVNWNTVPPVDILCGGFPCQDVSAAGKRAGIKHGTRSGLWSVFADAIEQLRPHIVVIENVRGLLSAAAHRTAEDDGNSDLEPSAAALGNRTGRLVLRAAGAVLGDLADLGYDAQWTTVAAADVGAPHRRDRVFILAADADINRPGGNELAAGGVEPAQSSTTHTFSAIRSSDKGIGPTADTRGDGCRGCAECDLKQTAELAAPQRDDADRRVLADGRDLGCAHAQRL